MSILEQVPTGTLPSDEERGMLRTSLRGFLQQHWPIAQAVPMSEQISAQRDIWRKLASQGLTALCTDATEGGVRELMIALEELGRAHCAAPLLDAALLNLALKGQTDDGACQTFLGGLQVGDIQPVLAFAALDADPQAGEVRVEEGRVRGHAAFVEGAQSATHFAVFTDACARLLLIEAGNSGISITPTRAMGYIGLSRIEFADVSAQSVKLEPSWCEDLLNLSRLGHLARAVGAADRSFEMATAYVKERKQFGQIVGRYQAVQHKLANNLIAMQAVRQLIENAASHFDRGIADWRVFALAACAYGNTALREVSLQTHHAFGAIGYAEDHEAPRHFKRVHLDVLRHGGGKEVREALAAHFLDGPPRGFPEYDLGRAGNAFRMEVRAWLDQNWTAAQRENYEASDRTHREWDAGFARALGKTGWLAANWPKRFGGQERTPFEMLAITEEMNRADAPRAGAPIQAASWIDFGSPAQQAHYLPEIASGEVMYGMWYSEPDSGSDLASLRTRATKDGDDWVINGQKIWTTTYWGDYMWLAARTDADAKPMHAGISMFVVRTDTPGISRKPIKTMYDGEFCNTFFDDVRIPGNALVGALNGGWAVLTGSLGVERAFVSTGVIMKIARQFEELCEYLRVAEARGKPLRADPIVRDLMGIYAARIEAGRQLAFNCVAMLARGETPTYEAAMTKVFAGELMEQFNEAAMDMLGMQATLSAGSIGAPLRGRLEQKLRHSLMWVISLGTNEIQRTLIAQRGLGLPR
jgi:alkylation response protein AidB-like acyl-CoA dehydrogenase